MGKAWKFGDNVDTDAIIPGKYLVISDGDELAKHIFENVRGDLREKIKRGDFIVAGRNFGCGSSREHDKGLIINLTKNESYRIKEFPEFLKEIIRCGGLIEFGKKIYKGSNSR